ncbi:MAG TPA: exosortase/archaeosortase family protein [Tepidisphaeraceae bacterium]|nr:exosortase/archaeosortase family protein [Tepidisphaeraceae bacterium]
MPPTMEATVLSPVDTSWMSRPRAPHRSRRILRTDRWTAWHVVAATAMGTLAVLATIDAWSDIFLIARKNEEYSHIFLVPLVAAAMIYVRRARFRYCKSTGTFLGFAIAGLGWAVHVFGFYHNFESLWHIGAVLVLIGCVLSVFGKHALFRFFPAFAVLVFLVPVPGMLRLRLAAPLETWTAHISELLLNAVGIAVTRSGNLLRVGDQAVNIAEACNGLRMVFALILVSYFFGFALPLRNSVRFIILLASPFAAILCNVARILPTVWLYGHSKQAGEVFHDYSGWLMLPISFLILLVIIAALRWAMVPVMRYTLAS